MRIRRACRLVLVVLLLAPALSLSSEPVLLGEKSDAILDLEGETQLQLVGIHGTISLRQGKARVLQFAARNLDNKRTERTVALWLEGNALILAPVDGDEEPMLIEVSVPPELELDLEVFDSRVQITGVHGRTRLTGEAVDLKARSLDGSLELDLSGGSVDAERVHDGVNLEGSGLEVRLTDIAGPVELSLKESSLELVSLRDETELDLDATSLVASGIVGRIRLEADGAPVEINGTEAGGELVLSEATLELRQTKGVFDVRTDSDVQFNNHMGPLRIEGYGSNVRGAQAQGGLLEVQTDRAEVKLDDLQGVTTVRGDGLDVHVSNCKGDLTVTTTGSKVVVEKAETPVVVQNEFGDVEIIAATGTIQVTSRDGAVRVRDLKAKAEIKADGPEVEVHWITIPGHETSTIENGRGDVRIQIPDTIRCRLDAKAPFGRIETDLDELRVSDDGHHAAGELKAGRGPAPQIKKPTIRMVAGADLYVYSNQPGGGRQ